MQKERKKERHRWCEYERHVSKWDRELTRESKTGSRKTGCLGKIISGWQEMERNTKWWQNSAEGQWLNSACRFWYNGRFYHRTLRRKLTHVQINTAKNLTVFNQATRFLVCVARWLSRCLLLLDNCCAQCSICDEVFKAQLHVEAFNCWYKCWYIKVKPHWESL